MTYVTCALSASYTGDQHWPIHSIRDYGSTFCTLSVIMDCYHGDLRSLYRSLEMSGRPSHQSPALQWAHSSPQNRTALKTLWSTFVCVFELVSELSAGIRDSQLVAEEGWDAVGGWLRGTAVERWSWPANFPVLHSTYSWWVTTYVGNRLLQVNQPGQLSILSLWGQLVSSKL